MYITERFANLKYFEVISNVLGKNMRASKPRFQSKYISIFAPKINIISASNTYLKNHREHGTCKWNIYIFALLALFKHCLWVVVVYVSIEVSFVYFTNSQNQMALKAFLFFIFIQKDD